jgi:hypothetical protein
MSSIMSMTTAALSAGIFTPAASMLFAVWTTVADSAVALPAASVTRRYREGSAEKFGHADVESRSSIYGRSVTDSSRE